MPRFVVAQPYSSQLPSQKIPPSSSKKKHICGTCARSFSIRGHLSRHGRVHTGERNYRCPFPGCETRCSRQDNLQQHYRIHLSPGSRRNCVRKNTPRKHASASRTPESTTQGPGPGSPLVDKARIILYPPSLSDSTPPLAQAALLSSTTLPPISAPAALITHPRTPILPVIRSRMADAPPPQYAAMHFRPSLSHCCYLSSYGPPSPTSASSTPPSPTYSVSSADGHTYSHAVGRQQCIITRRSPNRISFGTPTLQTQSLHAHHVTQSSNPGSNSGRAIHSSEIPHPYFRQPLAGYHHSMDIGHGAMQKGVGDAVVCDLTSF